MDEVGKNLLESIVMFLLSCTLILPSNILVKAITLTVVAFLFIHISVKLTIDK